MKKICTLLFSIVLLSTNCTKDDDNNDEMALAGLWLLSNQTTNVELNFKAVSDSTDVSCDSNFTITKAVNGSTSKTLTLQDLRLYISDIYLIDTNGAEIPVTLTNDGTWQYNNAVLLDFENKSLGTLCGNTGTSDTNTKAKGTIPSSSATSYKGVKFTLGLPYSVNKLDNTTSPSPFNISAMYWSWANGYKFTKIEFDDENGYTTSFHLGSTGCSSGSMETSDCSNPYRSTITLTQDSGFDLSSNYIALDLNELLNNFDPSASSSGLSCMPVGKPSGSKSTEESTQCPYILTSVGLSSSDGTETGSQTAFKIK